MASCLSFSRHPLCTAFLYKHRPARVAGVSHPVVFKKTCSLPLLSHTSWGLLRVSPQPPVASSLRKVAGNVTDPFALQVVAKEAAHRFGKPLLKDTRSCRHGHGHSGNCASSHCWRNQGTDLFFDKSLQPQCLSPLPSLESGNTGSTLPAPGMALTALYASPHQQPSRFLRRCYQGPHILPTKNQAISQVTAASKGHSWAKG